MNAVTHRHLEIYFQQLLTTAINKALFQKRLGALQKSIRILRDINELYHEVKNSQNPDTQHVCARYMLTQGIIFMENGDHSLFKYRIKCLLEAVKHLLNELKRRLKGINFISLDKIKSKLAFKIQRNVRSLVNLRSFWLR